MDTARVLDHPPADGDDAPVGGDEAHHDPQQSRLAAAGCTEDRRQRSLGHVEVDVGEHVALAVRLRHALAAEPGHRSERRTVPNRLMTKYAAASARPMRTAANGAAAANAKLELFALNSVPSV